MNFSVLDTSFFALYFIVVIGIAIWMSIRSSKEEKSAENYFLAGKSLPWWVVGGSLIASNISAEQFIGMSGSGFKIGMAIASYEFMAAASLVLIAWFIIPVFLKKGIYTMPQFIEQRFDKRVRTGLAIFWLFLFVFVNITTVLYLGALTLKATFGTSILFGVIGLGLYSSTFSIFGGLKTVVWTDLIQVVFLIGGGLLTTYLALDAFSNGSGVIAGMSQLMDFASEKFNMILDKGELIYQTDAGESRDAWEDLPGVSVLIGGMWIANIYYWGMNQYIIQRALAAKSLFDARKGIVFAAFIKLFLPLIVVVPGIIAYAMQKGGTELVGVEKGDQIYSWILNTFVSPGLKGLCFAALIAAVGSSISSMVNSVSTIFTLDIYKEYINKGANDSQLVKIGKISAGLALLIAILISPMFDQLDQVFQFIQKYTGFFSPGILVIFLFGLFWSKAKARAAMAVVLISLPFSLGLDMLFPDSVLPFLNKMGISFLFLSFLMVVISLLESREDDEKAIKLEASWFNPGTGFIVTSVLIFGILSTIYILLW